MSPAVGVPIFEFTEWEQRTLPLPVALSEGDRDLCDRLRTGTGPRLEIDELANGVRIAAKSWVGVVEFSCMRVHVVPKLAGDYLGLVRMLDWTAGLDALRDLESEHALDVAGQSLLDLIALLLVRASERITRAGLRSDYVQHEDALGVLRGRLVFERQLRRRHGRLDRLECRFDDRSPDIFDNQLLLAAAERCAARVRQVDVRRRATRQRTILADVCDARHVALPRREIHYDRLNSHYRPAHELAWLVLEGTRGLEDLYTHGSTRSFAFLIDMNQLFEEFVERVLAQAVAGRNIDLSFQRPSSSVVRRSTGGPYLRLIPDTVAQIGEIPVPVDAKYKLYSSKDLASADVAQAFIYASGLGAAPESGPPHALIVYPAEGRHVERLPLVVRHREGALRCALTAVGIPVAGILDEVATRSGSRPLLSEIAEIVCDAAAPVD